MFRYAIAVALSLFMLASPAGAHSVDQHAEHEMVTTIPTLGGDFTLTDEDGKTFTQADLKGSPTALFFGFTSCPDICPTTLYDLVELKKKLGPNGEKIRILMVTIDPAVDTAERMKTYLDAFDPAFTGLTGTQEQINTVANLFRVVSRTDNGVIRHSPSVYLMDENGDFSDAITYQEDPLSALRKLNALFD